MRIVSLLPPVSLISDVERALGEDIGSGDVTAALLSETALARATVVCRDDAVIAGGPWFDACFRQLDAKVVIEWQVTEGARVAADTVICRLHGRARVLVSAERSALNFLQTLSGTATTTAAYVAAVSGTKAIILDTRKTLPGLRAAQKYAVRMGGGSNHRHGLFDAVLIKENHIAAAGSIATAVERARRLSPTLPVIVEVESLAELDEAMTAQADRVLLDDFSLDQMQAAVARAAGRIPLEVSGGVDLARVRAIAETGVNYISIGALTKHVRAIDFSMRLE